MISESTQNCSNFPISELSFRNSPKNFRRNDFLVLSHFSPNSIFSDFTPASSWNGSVHAPFIWVHSACLPSLSVPLALHPLTPFHCLGSVCIWRPSVHALAVECGCCCWLGELRGRVGQRQVGFLQIGKEIIPKNHGVENEDSRRFLDDLMAFSISDHLFLQSHWAVFECPSSGSNLREAEDEGARGVHRQPHLRVQHPFLLQGNRLGQHVHSVSWNDERGIGWETWIIHCKYTVAYDLIADTDVWWTWRLWWMNAVRRDSGSWLWTIGRAANGPGGNCMAATFRAGSLRWGCKNKIEDF